MLKSVRFLCKLVSMTFILLIICNSIVKYAIPKYRVFDFMWKYKH